MFPVVAECLLGDMGDASEFAFGGGKVCDCLIVRKPGTKQVQQIHHGFGLTNSGTLQANAASTLQVSTNLTNFNAGALTGGTYVANGTTGHAGIIQLNLAPNTGGEILTNAATIVLNGPTAVIVDSNGNNALESLSNNTGSLTVTGGQVFSTGASFTNGGTLHVGAASSFSSADYTQGSTGIFDEDVAGPNAFGVIDATDAIDLLTGSILDVNLVNGFDPAANTDYAFVIMDGSGVTGVFSNVYFTDLPAGDTWSVNYSTPGEVILDIDGAVTGGGGGSPVPEPGTFGLMFTGIASLAAGLMRRRAKSV
jgi:hypothetical protein